MNIKPWRERADCDWQAEIDELRAALKAQPVQEPVAWMHDPESYSIVDARQKEMNEFQYSPEFLAGHTIPLYRAPVQPVQPALTDLSRLEPFVHGLGKAILREFQERVRTGGAG